MHEKDLSFLSEDYKQIIDNADDIKEKFTQQPFLLDRLYDILWFFSLLLIFLHWNLWSVFSILNIDSKMTSMPI